MGAGNSSIATNEINKNISSSVTSVLQSQIDASSRALCMNSVELENISNCNMQFDGQTCDASVISSVTADTNFTEKTSQSVFDQTTQLSDALTDPGFGSFGNSSRSSNIQNLNVNVAKSVDMSMRTDCSVEARAINQIVVRNVKCTPGDTVNYKFGKQAVTVSMVADCVARHGASTESVQDLSTFTDQTAKATTKGGGLWDLIILLLMLPLMTFLMPLALRKGFTAFKDKDKPSPPTIGAIVLCVILGIAICGWWPGYMAFQLGVQPWPYPYSEKDMSNGRPVCKDGVFDRSTVMNSFMFYDPNCYIYNQVNKTTGSGCPEDAKQIHYKNCGIFSGKCDSPQLADEIDSFKKVAKICGEMPVLDGVEFCTAENLASIMFRDEYPTCQKYKDGVFINETFDLSSGATPKVDPNVFWASGVKYQPGKEAPVPVLCNNRPNCVGTESDLMKTSPDDCLDPDYQTRKGLFIQAKKQCMDLNAAVPEALKNNYDVEGGVKITLKNQCRQNPSMYFKGCNGDKCTYEPAGCKNGNCGGVPLDVIRACHNDYTGCEEVDDEYRQDMEYVNGLEALCKKRYNDWEARNPVYWQWTIGVYLGLILCIVVLFVVGHKKQVQQRQKYDEMEARGEYTGRSHRAGYNALGLPDSYVPPFMGRMVGTPSVFWGMLLFLIMCWAVVGVPFGKLGAGLEMGPLYNKDENGNPSPFISKIENWKPEEQILSGAIWTGVFTVLIIILVASYARTRKKYAQFFQAQKNLPPNTSY